MFFNFSAHINKLRLIDVYLLINSINLPERAKNTKFKKLSQ